MNEPLSALRSLAASASGTQSVPELEKLVANLLGQIGPLLKQADSSSGKSFLNSLVAPGTSPDKPIKPKDPTQPIWVKTPASIDIVNLSQSAVSQAIQPANIKPVGTKDCQVTFPAP